MSDQQDQEGLWLPAPDDGADLLDPLGDLLRRVSAVTLAHRQHYHLQTSRHVTPQIEYKAGQLGPWVTSCPVLRCGASRARSPSCPPERWRHPHDSWQSPTEMPKLRQCIRQKLVSQILELKRFWGQAVVKTLPGRVCRTCISPSPSQRISGSAPRVSVTNLWCWGQGGGGGVEGSSSNIYFPMLSCPPGSRERQEFYHRA